MPQCLAEPDVPFKLIGSGSTYSGERQRHNGIIPLNHCHNIRINTQQEPPVILPRAARTSATSLRPKRPARSFQSEMGWAACRVRWAARSTAMPALSARISPGLSISIQALLRDEGEKTLTADDLQFAYRSSILKRERKELLILSATLKAERSTREAAWKTLMDMSQKRQATQPTGASTGSTFKNPPGDYAGRLIEAAGLKGFTGGHAQFSGLHANFIVNDGSSSAQEYLKLIRTAQKTVKEKFGVQLELEIELIGEFNDAE